MPHPQNPAPRWRTLLSSLALITAGAQAQEPTARLVKDANRTPVDFTSAIDWVMPVGTGKSVIFPRQTLALGSELHTSDGTPRGTRLLKELVPGPASHMLVEPFLFGTTGNTKVAFRADDDRLADGIWVTDGTQAGTIHVFASQYTPPTGGSTMRTAIPGGFFFEDYLSNDDSSHTLYFSDGTAAGTWPLNPLVGETRERFSEPRVFISSGSAAYFLANDNEVWRSDGTPAGTAKIATIPAQSGSPSFLAVAGSRIFITTGKAGAQPPQLLHCPIDGGDLTNITPPEAAAWTLLDLQPASALGDQIFFTAWESSTVRTLWVSDGTNTGTRHVPLLAPGATTEPKIINSVVKWKDAVYLTTLLQNREELWRTDGTEAGTILLKHFDDQHVNIPTHSQEDSDTFHFHAPAPDPDGQLLWQTKGDAASTKPVPKTPDCFFRGVAAPPQFATVKSGLIFSADQAQADAALHRLKGSNGGSTRGTIQLTTPEKATGDGIPNYYGLPYEMLGNHLLQIVDTGNGLELWKMRPDGKGARSVWEVPGTIGQYPGHVGFEGTLSRGAIFTLADGAGHHEVWITNGTRAGTILLSRHETLTTTPPPDFLKLGDTMFYSVADPDARKQRSLWKTDGTLAGTSRVVAADGISHGPDGGEMVEFQGFIYYLSSTEPQIGKTSLWRTDGTEAGTTLVKEGWGVDPYEKAGSLSVAGGKLYFAARARAADYLWESDGTPANTVMVPDITFKPGTLRTAYDLNGVAVFRARGSADAYEQWWRRSGTDTSRVRNNILTPQLPLFDSRFQVLAGGKIFYRGMTPGLGYELWVTDGTDAGTHLVKDINPGLPSSDLIHLTPIGDDVYFSAWNSTFGFRIWRSDGTEEGTVPAANFGPGTGYDIAEGLKPMAGKLYFHQNRPEIGDELHYIDLPQD